MPRFRILLFGLLLSSAICHLTSLSSPVLAANDFQSGWWIDRDVGNTNVVSTYAAEGNTLVLLAGWLTSTSQVNSTLAYLDKAQANGLKMIIGLEGGATPTMSTTGTQPTFQTVVNALKAHPALYGWYIGDEPELTSDQNLITTRHTIFASNPGYYPLLKSLDPNHPVIISFNQPYNQTQWNNQAVFYDVTDIIGIHSYPFWTGAEFGTSEGRSVYDVWSKGLATANSLGKDFIATGQGFGNNSGSPYRNPTINELRYQVFSAMVLGIDKILFWIDSWGQTSGMMTAVAQQVGQIQAIGAEMNHGITNDSRIGVSVGTTQLTYRYGVNNNRYALLAVNIANRTSAAGLTLTNVVFTLPASLTINEVTVINENRTLTVTNHAFTDTFKPFEVHQYAFTPSTPPVPGDYDGDGDDDFIDLKLALTQFTTIFNLNQIIRNFGS